MALYINPGNFSGLAAIASNTTPAYHFPIAGASPTGALFAGIGQGLQNITNQQNVQQELAMKQQEMDSLSKYRDAQTSIAQQQLAQQQAMAPYQQQMMQQNVANDQVKNELMKQQLAMQQLQMRSAMSQTDLNKRSGFAAAILTQPDLKTQNNILDAALKSGSINQDEYESFKQSDLPTRKALATQDLMLSGHAKDYMDLQKSMNPMGTAGVNMTFDPQTGNPTSMNINPSKKTEDDAQKNLVQNQQQMQRLNLMMDTLDQIPNNMPSPLTVEGKGTNLVGKALQSSSTLDSAAQKLGLDTSGLKDYASKAGAFYAATTQHLLTMMHQLVGARFTQAQVNLMSQAIPRESDPPGVFKAKAQESARLLQMDNALQSEAATKGPEYLKSSDYKNKLQQEVDFGTSIAKPIVAKNPKTGVTTQYSYDDLAAIAAHNNNMSIEEVRNRLQQGNQ